MIKFQIGDNSLEINTKDASKRASQNWTGNEKEIDLIKFRLYGSRGMHGHLIGESSPAIDVYHALFYTDLNKLGAEIVEGQDILDAYKPEKLPKGRVY